jgi:hypothetical protein
VVEHLAANVACYAHDHLVTQPTFGSFVRGRSDVLAYLAAFHHEHRPADNRDVFKRVKSTATRSASNPGAMAPILPFMLSDSAAIDVADMMASMGFWPRHL